MDENSFRQLYQIMISLLPHGVRRHSPTTPYFTGYPYGTLYDWDQYFEALVQLYAGWPCDYMKNGVKIFLSRQAPDGGIGRSVPEGGGPTYYKHTPHVKPFLAQECLLCLHAEGSLEWLRAEERYLRLRKYLLHWLKDLDVRGEGLSVWREAEHTGMDNHYERAGKWGERESFCEGVDLNSYLVRESKALSIVAATLGETKDAELFEQEAARRAEAIARWLWNEEEGIFYDFDAVKKEPVRVKYAGAFLPLWSGTASATQATRLLKSLLDPGEFWRPYPIPALAASEPGYVEGFPEGHPTGCCSWRAHSWLPLNYMIFHGLRDYGFKRESEELASKTIAMFKRGPFSEYYASESGIGTGQKPFWGWSCLALFMELEAKLDANPCVLAPDSGEMPRMRKEIMRLTA